MIYILFPVAFIWWSFMVFKRGYEHGKEEALWSQLSESFRKNALNNHTFGDPVDWYARSSFTKPKDIRDDLNIKGPQ